MDKFIDGDHVSVGDGRPNHHTANNYPPRVRHKLPRCKVKMVKKLHDERMDGEPEATRKSSLIKANFPVGKGASLFTLPGKTSPGPLRKLESIFKFAKNLYFQGTIFLKGMEGTDDSRSGRMGGRRSTRKHGGRCIDPGSFLTCVRGRALSKSPDLSSKPILSPLRIPRTDRNQT